MTVKTWHNGNEVFYINGKWVHADGTDGYNYKPCPVCGKLPHEDGRDACLQKIPGVTSACCGHGIEGLAVVVFGEGKELRGKEAIEFLEKWKEEQEIHRQIGNWYEKVWKKEIVGKIGNQ